MLQMTKKVEYGLIALVYIGRNTGRSVSAREVASQNEIPLSLTANVLKSLAREGVLATRRGATGGYTLDRRPTTITLGEVVRAVEGEPAQLTPCCREMGMAGCDLTKRCSIKGAIIRLNERLWGNVGAMSLAEFMGEPLA